MPVEHAASTTQRARPQIALTNVRYRYPYTPKPDAADDSSEAAPAARPALDGITLTIEAGSYVCVLGANGSGKSTLVQLMNALIAPSEGAVELFGIDASSPEGALAIRRRAAMVFQHPDDQMVTSVVADDVAFGPENLGVPQPEIAQRVDEALAAVDMTAFAHADPADLSGGQRQRVAIAGALAMHPDVLLLDEPAAMLDVAGRHAIQRIIHDLNQRGITIVHVTHFMDDALLAQRVVVLESGRIALDGTPDEVFSHTDAINRLGLELPFTMRLAERIAPALPAGATLPRTAHPDELARALAPLLAPADHAPRPIDSQPPACPPTPAEAADALVFENVSFSYVQPRSTRRRLGRRRDAEPIPDALHQVSFRVPTGSLTALIGRTGSGKSTTVELACALKLPRTGTVRVAGIDTTDRARRRELRAHIGYVSQFPERQLFAETVFDDIAFGPRNLGLSDDEVHERVTEALRALGTEPTPELLARSPFELSGGQQRTVALAGVVAMHTPVLVLDEPMAGLDPRGRTRMRAFVRDLKQRGVTILLVTHDMDDAAAMADQVIALSQGRVALQGTPAEVFSAADLIERGSIPGRPDALAFAELLAQHGVSYEPEPLTLDDLVEEVRHGIAH